MDILLHILCRIHYEYTSTYTICRIYYVVYNLFAQVTLSPFFLILTKPKACIWSGQSVCIIVFTNKQEVCKRCNVVLNKGIPNARRYIWKKCVPPNLLILNTEQILWDIIYRTVFTWEMIWNRVKWEYQGKKTPKKNHP